MSVLLAEVVNLGYWVVCSSPSVPSYPHELTTKKSIGVTRGMTNNLEVNCPVKVKGRSHPFPFPALTASIYCFFYQITIVCAIKISYIKTCISWMCFDDKNLSSLNLMSDQYISYISALFIFFLSLRLILFLAQNKNKITRAKCAYLKFHGIYVANLIVNHIHFNKSYFYEAVELFSI